MFDIVHLDTDFVVINKHPNVSVHKDDGDTMLLNEVAKVTQDEQLYLVHRLDKMTSGLLLLARSKQAASELSQLFAQRNVSKFYLAIGSKKPKKKQGLVSGDMERSRRSAWKLTPSKNNPAVTQFFSRAGEVGERLFLCKPYTGKTHQIRVALKSIGSAIVGDPIYNPASVSDRGYLHAYALCFHFRDNYYQFRCIPTAGDKWRSEPVCQALEEWKAPWALSWPLIEL